MAMRCRITRRPANIALTACMFDISKGPFLRNGPSTFDELRGSIPSNSLIRSISIQAGVPLTFPGDAPGIHQDGGERRVPAVDHHSG